MPKLAEAIITGTMARPSRPSVRFTALPAPTTTSAPNAIKNQPRLITTSLKNGITIDDESGARPSRISAKHATSAMTISMISRVRPAKPLWLCFVTFR